MKVSRIAYISRDVHLDKVLHWDGRQSADTLHIREDLFRGPGRAQDYDDPKKQYPPRKVRITIEIL